MAATTDSGRDVRVDPKGKPGITNLLLLFSALTETPLRDIEKRYHGKGYGDFKKGLAEAAVKALAPFQAAKKKVTPAIAKKVLAQGAKEANAVAEKKLADVKQKIGIAV